MYISMDEFNKMALAAAAARVIDINKNSDGTVEPDTIFRVKLGVHTLMTGLVALMSAIAYLDKTDDDTVNTLDTLLATLCVVGLANFLLSLLNLVAELRTNAPFYDKLRNRVLNSARNTMTSLSLIIGGIVFGMQTDGLTWTIIIAVGVQRLVDCMLDIGEYGTEVQCPGDEDKASGTLGINERMKNGGSKTLISTFGLLAFGSVIFLLIYYKGDLGADLGEDDNLWLVALIGVCLHTLLVLFTFALQMFEGVQNTFRSCLGGKDCDGVSVHSLNEIPILSALVFTVTIGIVGILVGEALEEDTSVKLLGAVLALLALVETAGRRMI